jgi:iron complex transport system ATP-binding protein
MTPLLTLSNVSFAYSNREVLAGISLSLNAGSCSALAGPNGCGKTTLLRIASGALMPTAGSVLLDGVALGDIPRRRRSCVVALVPQLLEVPFDFTVQQIVEQGRTPYLSLLRGPDREDRRAVDRALEMTDCLRFRHRIFNELSGGERQRVKIALGLAQEPKLLLLDEPTQSLDIGRQAELIDLLHHLCEQGITIFASIHDLHLIDDDFTTVHLLDAERGLVSGRPRTVLTPANLVSAFNCRPGRHPMLNKEASLQECV